MRIQKTVLLLALALPVASLGCAEADARAKDLVAGVTEKVDLSSLSVEGMQGKVDELTATVSSKLSGVANATEALDLRTQLEPMLGQLEQLKQALGDKMPDLSSLSGVVSEVRTKFASNSGVLDALKPILERIQSLGS